MTREHELEAIAAACVAANAVIAEYGSSEMRAIIRVLLFAVGQALARERDRVPDGRDDGRP